jgi:hypothetical protein
LLGVQASQFRKEQKEAAAAGQEPTGGQGEVSHIGDVLDRGAGALRPLLVQTPGQRSKALGFEDFAHRRGAQRELSLFEDFADFINGVILLTKGNDQVAGGGLLGLGTGSGS